MGELIILIFKKLQGVFNFLAIQKKIIGPFNELFKEKEKLFNPLKMTSLPGTIA